MLKQKRPLKYKPVEGYKHVGLDDKGVPYIQGTTMKIVELVSENTGWGWGAEELHHQHPYLTLGQVHSALSYYHDHKDEVDRDIERRIQLVDKIFEEMGPSPLAARLKAKGLL